MSGVLIYLYDYVILFIVIDIDDDQIWSVIGTFYPRSITLAIYHHHLIMVQRIKRSHLKAMKSGVRKVGRGSNPGRLKVGMGFSIQGFI